ncbi:hypothetical protein [Cribrihabitans neustonicus]|uniref:hypothetical protein n=1 Tax=Cribrihabitans neustonicus TaxID=1429085 RepID=UPI003B59ED5A
MPAFSACFCAFAWFALALAAGCPAQAQSLWEFQVTPMLVAPSVEGRTELGWVGGGLSLRAANPLSELDAGGMLQFEARHAGGAGVLLRYAVLDAEQDADSTAGRLPVAYEQRIAEAAATYRFGTGRDRFDAYAGLRHWDVGVEAGPARQAASWTEPMAGLRWQRRLSQDYSLLLEGDAGGFGAGSDLSWSVMGGLIYHRWKRASIYVMYRGLGVDFERGSPGSATYFRHDATTHSLLAGIGFRF